MNEFLFRMPTRVIFGAGSIKKVPQLCKEQGFARVFVVTGTTSTRKSSYLHEMIAEMDAIGITTHVFSEVEADPSVETVTKGAAELTAFAADAVIAFGGGSPMDAAKSVSMISANGGSILDYMQAHKTYTKRGVPLICIPTTAGTGSEVTAAAVTTDKDSRKKIGVSHDFQMPAFAILDPVLHVTMPPSVTAATGIDALTHAIETFIAMKANPITDSLALSAIKMIGENLRLACANGENLEARGNMAIASLIAGGAFTNAGLGAVHGIAHPVGAQFGVAHGVANGILLPFVMEYCLMANYPKFRDIAAALGKSVEGVKLRDAAQLSVEAVRELKQDIGIPATLADVNIPANALAGIVQDATTYRQLPNSPRQLKVEDLQIIVSAALGL
ncbi:MAG TPA: iron-containing alcohol dehydrogenase [Negativicutes bacterium]|nr:iron-containing alcohol dehydrogenase [Negativicutes bacterium]